MSWISKSNIHDAFCADMSCILSINVTIFAKCPCFVVFNQGHLDLILFIVLKLLIEYHLAS